MLKSGLFDLAREGEFPWSAIMEERAALIEDEGYSQRWV